MSRIIRPPYLRCANKCYATDASSLQSRHALKYDCLCSIMVAHLAKLFLLNNMGGLLVLEKSLRIASNIYLNEKHCNNHYSMRTKPA